MAAIDWSGLGDETVELDSAPLPGDPSVSGNGTATTPIIDMGDLDDGKKGHPRSRPKVRRSSIAVRYV